MNENRNWREGWFLFIALLSFVCLLAVFVVFLNNVPAVVKYVPPKLAEVEASVTVPVPVPDQYAVEPLEAQAYQLGYVRGQAALFTQLNRPELLAAFHVPQQQVLYTKFEDAPAEDRERYDAIMTQGYIDGYHRASDSMHCPAGVR